MRWWAGAALAAILSAGPVHAEDADPNAATRLLPATANGSLVYRVFVYLENPGDDAARNEAVRREVAVAFPLQSGASFEEMLAEQGVRKVRALPDVASAEYRVYKSPEAGKIWVAVLVKTGTKEEEAAEPSFWSGNLSRHLELMKTDRGFFKLVFNGGAGLFLDNQAWFGKPQDFVATAYSPPNPTFWGELYVEGGLGGVLELWDTPLYLYGSATYLVSTRLGSDVFAPDPTIWGAWEKAYAGLLYAPKGSSFRLDFSLGRQLYEVNNDFLVSPIPGAVNASYRGGSYIGARHAYKNTASLKVLAGDLTAQAFYLQPNELPEGDTDTRYLGANVRWEVPAKLELAAAFMTAVTSIYPYVLPDGATRERKGLMVVNPRLMLSNPLGADGLWLQAEGAYQWNVNFPMSAWAWYGWAGYSAKKAPWTPEVSLRYAVFSGDDPSTPSYNRFDQTLSGKQDYWMQGINFVKVSLNSNLRSWRATARAKPLPGAEIILDYYYLFADTLNNLGAYYKGGQQLTDLRLAQEVMLTASWFATPNLYTSFVASWTTPMAGLRSALGPGTGNWLTIQLAAYWFI
ncbi:MAG: alginate export family protein [Anaeromyxobacteraceae bacterium]